MDPAIESQQGPGWVAGRMRGGRPSQQDDLVCLHDPVSNAQLLVLADGMGGDGAGEIASAGVIAVARALWQRGSWRELPGALFLEQLCQEAHAELGRRGEGLVGAEPHSTVVALLLKDSHAYWAHVGDSRLYRLQRGHLLCCTEDHSLARARVRRGELDGSQAAGVDDQHMLLRGLGGPRAPQVDHGWAPWRGEQRFVLCSDGVWDHLSADELARLAERRLSLEALHEALALVLERGGSEGDNAALIVVRARPERVWRRLKRWWSRRFGGHWASLSETGPGRVPTSQAERMSVRSGRAGLRGIGHGLLFVLVVVPLAGCSQLPWLQHRSVQVERPPAAPTPVAARAGPVGEVPSLVSIIDRQLQRGHYEEGERQLRRYLQVHPSDRMARTMLYQLTADPQQWLGSESQSHPVQAGDSYGALAQRYLGDAKLFLILARYNHSDDPSRLLVGQDVRVPLHKASMKELRASTTAAIEQAPSGKAPVAPTVAAGSASALESRSARSLRLQKEGLALLDSGQSAPALQRIDQALALDPGLASTDADSPTLRQRLVASCHQRAIVLYRDQRLDPAIALWDRVLLIAPGYEPAVAYRARAMELKRRLKQL